MKIVNVLGTVGGWANLVRNRDATLGWKSASKGDILTRHTGSCSLEAAAGGPAVGSSLGHRQHALDPVAAVGRGWVVVVLKVAQARVQQAVHVRAAYCASGMRGASD